MDIPMSKIDADGDGHVDKEELKNFLPPHVPDDHVDEVIKRSDHNRDGKLDKHEFRHMLEQRCLRFARLVVLPKRERERRARDQVDGEYEDHMNCRPPPIFMLTISLVIIGIFIHHTLDMFEEKGWIGINGPPPLRSILIYNPYRRYEAWRFLTYMFVHSGWMHITSNVIMQLFLGILLELVHKWWRVMIVYFAGVVFGSLATSVSDPGVYLAGASGGVYALIAAHLATVIMNWKEMEMPWVQVVCITAFGVVDVGTAVYYRYIVEEDQKIGYAAHIGGALAGLLVGIYILKNLRWSTWEKYLWWVVAGISAVLFVFGICWNLFYTDYFPEPRYGEYY